MATTSFENEPRLAPSVQAVLDALRVRVRWYVWLDGLAGGLAWLGLAFWISLGIDWAFEPSRAVRTVVLAVIGLVLLGVIAQLILRRAFVSMSNSNMATLLERRFRKLDDSLLTAVFLTGHHVDPEKCNPAMLARTCREAAERIGDVELLRVFDPAPLLRKAGAALVLAASIVAFAAICPETLGFWARRTIQYPMSDELYPRRTQLTIYVDGKEYEGPVSVVSGSKVKIRVVANPTFEVPDTVEIRYWTEGSGRTPDLMKQTKNEFEYEFRSVVRPVTFDIIGGDDRRYDLQINVVESPFITKMTLDYAIPDYLKPRLEDRADVPITGAMQVRAGTVVTVRALTNKPLRSVEVQRITEAGPERPVTFPGASKEGFEYAIEPLGVQTVVQFRLVDTDGIPSAKPFALTLNALPDTVPDLGEAKLDGIGEAVTPKAVIPLQGRVLDDNGVRAVWAEASVDDKPLPSQQLAAPEDRPQRFSLGNARVRVEELKLAPGQKLLLGLRASDHYDLQKKWKGFERTPDVGASEQWRLEVVTPEQLQARLEDREYDLRRRFEQVLQEVTETLNLLMMMDFEPPGKGGPTAGKEPGYEPGDTADEKAATPEELRIVRAAEALQYCRKNTEETRGVADGFDHIRKQIVNNQIDNEELKRRLGEQIAKPLHDIVDNKFPELERQLVQLQAAAGKLQRGGMLRDDAKNQTIVILAAMRQVLERMKELEDYNQAVELLRTIIKLQESFERVVKERHKQTIRDLKED